MLISDMLSKNTRIYTIRVLQTGELLQVEAIDAPSAFREVACMCPGCTLFSIVEVS